MTGSRGTATVDLRVAAHVRKIVSGWPPLTPEQRDRLAALLRSASPMGGADDAA